MSDDSQFENMTKEYKDYVEMKAFANSQQKTITQLCVKIKKLEDDKKHLEQMLADRMPILLPSTEKITLSTEITNQEIICRRQIEILMSTSNERELTAEECKKLVEYSKLLKMLETKDTIEKKSEDDVTNLPTEKLLQLVVDNEQSNSDIK